MVELFANSEDPIRRSAASDLGLHCSNEAVLTSTHNQCFERKYEKYRNLYLKTYRFWW